MTPITVPCNAIQPDPAHADPTAAPVSALVDSIREQGLLRPIVVRPAGDGYVIVHGERRWRAVQALGHATIAVWVVIDLVHRSGAGL